ncbi:MAG: hypothetical protein QM731_22320 [Chitinophagaceae bacterium]
MKQYKQTYLVAGIAIAMTLGIIACHKSSDTPVMDVQLKSSAQYGQVLTDSAGRTLYFFSLDANGSSGCTGGCLTVWPVFYKATLRLSAGLNSSDFGTITRSDGKPQTTYKGWPLYYYQNDVNAGDINGEAVNNVWFVAKPDYTVMLANIQLVGQNGVQYNSQLQPGQGVTQYITDAWGHTLYSFSPDKFKKNTFTKSDFSNNTVWPIDTIQSVQYMPSILSKADFDTAIVFGKVQITYKGWPLYYYGKDSSVRGNTRGVSVPSPGVWPIVNKSSTVAPQ